MTAQQQYCHAKRWDLFRVGEMSYCCCAVMQGAEIYVVFVKCHTVDWLSCKALRSMSCGWNAILLLCCHARRWDLCHVGEMSYCCCAVMQSAEIYVVWVKCHTDDVLSCKALRPMSCGWNAILLLCDISPTRHRSQRFAWQHINSMTFHPHDIDLSVLHTSTTTAIQWQCTVHSSSTKVNMAFKSISKSMKTMLQ